MIENIFVKNVASFNDQGQNIQGLKKINFFYGANGSGKTTISRLLNNEDEYRDSVISWARTNKLKTSVYNHDFVKLNFHPDKELEGIFTLGENDEKIIQEIKKIKENLDKISNKIQNKKDTLDGKNGDKGKRGELEDLEGPFKEECWEYEKKYEGIFRKAFIGCLTKERFKTRLIQEAENNIADFLSFNELEEKAKIIFSDEQVEEDILPSIGDDSWTAFENVEILSKKIIGRDDLDIAAMIKALGNSDWVKKGIFYYDENNKICPFCQQKTDQKFAGKLEKYFDEAYQNDLAALEELIKSYNQFSASVAQQFDDILNAKPRYLNCEKLQSYKNLFDERIKVNKKHLEDKRKEASRVVKLESMQSIIDKIAEETGNANTEIRRHNLIISNLSKEKEVLTSQIWCFIVEQIKPAYRGYATPRDNFNKAITNLQNDIKNLEEEKRVESRKMGELEKEITSIKPTIDIMNKFLLSFGFLNFSFAESEKKGFYKIIRPNGEDVEETLSEGEKTFITFLYFYHLLKGSNTESGINDDCVVVFDDPVSSLDSQILFIVSHLIKNIFEEIRLSESNIKQIFIFTHNIYFHKEICCKTKGEHAFWIVKKDMKNSSFIESHKTNPIKSAYELLWQEVRKKDRSNMLQNTLRRILEYYFKILGGIHLDQIAENFERQDKQICASLISWAHDGSHYADEDLYIACDAEAVEKYLKIFKDIFEKSGHINHYNMMMKQFIA